MTERPQEKPQEKKLKQTLKQPKLEKKINVVPAPTATQQPVEIKKEEKPVIATSPSSMTQTKAEEKHEGTKVEQKQEVKTEEKKEKKSQPAKIVKKEDAIARGLSLHTSKKHCMYICSFIKNKTVDQAILDLEDVIMFKKVVPFKGEIPHRSALGVMSGRYPVKASGQIITILKGLRGNILANGMDVEKTKIYWASASWASRPAKRGGMRFKRTHVIFKAKEFQPKEEKKK